MKKYYTVSDGGAILFGNEDFTFSVFNNYGDCRNTILVFENDCEFTEWLFSEYHSRESYKCGFNTVACIDGTFNLYKWDCFYGEELKKRENIKAKFNGSYFVELRCECYELPIFAIIKR